VSQGIQAYKSNYVLLQTRKRSSSKSHHLKVVIAERSRTRNLSPVSFRSSIQGLKLTAIGPVPEITVVPAEFTTFTDTLPVVMPRNEKPLKPGVKFCVPRVVLPLVTTAFNPVWPAATRMPACGEVRMCKILTKKRKYRDAIFYCADTLRWP